MIGAVTSMRRNGFTLIELMAVMLLMALLAGAVVMTAGSSGSGPKPDAERLASRLAAARDSAITGARPVSFWASRSGYGFETYRAGQWHPVAIKPFEPVNWKNGTEIETGRTKGLDDGRVRLTFDNLGLPESPFTLQLARDGQRARIAVAANGDVSVS